MTDLRFETYDWKGGCEAMLRFGPAAPAAPADSDPIVVAALPLFEEANRTRQFMVTILRALAAAGIASVLPDLPGTGDSIVVTHASRLADQRDAYGDLIRQLGARCYALAIRGGALVDVGAPVAGRWHFAPQSGGEVVRELDRMRATARTERTDDGNYAGNTLSATMLADIRDASLHRGGAQRTVRLDTDPRVADAKYPGSPLWRRAEPGNDILLAQKLAADISQWTASCEH